MVDLAASGLLGRRRRTGAPLQRPARLPARLMNGAHVRDTRKMTKKRLKVVLGLRSELLAPGRPQTPELFWVRGLYSRIKPQGAVQAFGSVSPTVESQAGEDGCVCPDSPLQRTHGHQSHPLPPPPPQPICFDKHGEPLTAVSLLSCHVFGNAARVSCRGK